MRIVPSAFWPTALRVVRPFRWYVLNDSPDALTARPARTRVGPPPMAPHASGATPGTDVSISMREPGRKSVNRVTPERFLPDTTICPLAMGVPPPPRWATTVPDTVPDTGNTPPPSSATTTS